MRVGPNDTIANVPVRAIRDFLKKWRGNVDADVLAEGLAISAEDASLLMQALIAEDYVQPNVSTRQPGYELTIKGNALCMAKFIKPIARARGDLLVRELITRAEEVNRNGEFTHFVTEIIAFGSYVGDAVDLGDVDLVVRLAPRPGIGDFVTASTARADASGRSLNFIQRLAFGQSEVTKLVKGKSPYISIHDDTELELLKATTKRLFVAKLEEVSPAVKTYSPPR